MSNQLSVKKRKAHYINGAKLFAQKRNTRNGIKSPHNYYNEVEGACHHLANGIKLKKEQHLCYNLAKEVFTEFNLFEPEDRSERNQINNSYYWEFDQQGDLARSLALLFCAEMCN